MFEILWKKSLISRGSLDPQGDCQNLDYLFCSVNQPVLAPWLSLPSTLVVVSSGKFGCAKVSGATLYAHLGGWALNIIFQEARLPNNDITAKNKFLSFSETHFLWIFGISKIMICSTYPTWQIQFSSIVYPIPKVCILVLTNCVVSHLLSIIVEEQWTSMWFYFVHQAS